MEGHTMLANMFGDYLVANGKLTSQELADVKASLGKNRVKLGLIAVSEGLLDQKKAEEIRRKQAVMDKRFGDIAIELGYLNSQQVSHLLDMQGNAYMQFCQAVTDGQYMTIEELDQAFDLMSNEYNIEASDLDDIKADDIDIIVNNLMRGMEESSLDLLSIFVRTLNRLISTDILVKSYDTIASYKRNGLSYQCLEGDYNSIITLGGSDDGLILIASVFGCEAFEKVDMDSLDSIGEFLNIVNGLYATSLSYRNINVELMAPSLNEGETSLPFENLYKVPVVIDGKEIEIVLKVQK
jgi:hypothetical protein